MASINVRGLLTPTPEQIRDALLSLPDNERKFVITNPRAGTHKIVAIRRNGSGNVEYDYENIPE